MMAATPETEIVAGIGNDYKYGFHDEENYVFKSERGLSAEVVAAISMGAAALFVLAMVLPIIAALVIPPCFQ